LRDILGKTDADADIEEYYDKNGLARPWEAAPTSIRYGDGSDEGRKKTRPGRNQKQNNGSASEEPDSTDGQNKEELQTQVNDLN
jgi:hypothetical protein